MVQACTTHAHTNGDQLLRPSLGATVPNLLRHFVEQLQIDMTRPRLAFPSRHRQLHPSKYLLHGSDKQQDRPSRPVGRRRALPLIVHLLSFP
jgi:hypothetical protein